MKHFALLAVLLAACSPAPDVVSRDVDVLRTAVADVARDGEALVRTAPARIDSPAIDLTAELRRFAAAHPDVDAALVASFLARNRGVHEHPSALIEAWTDARWATPWDLSPLEGRRTPRMLRDAWNERHPGVSTIAAVTRPGYDADASRALVVVQRRTVDVPIDASGHAALLARAGDTWQVVATHAIEVR